MQMINRKEESYGCLDIMGEGRYSQHIARVIGQKTEGGTSKYTIFTASTFILVAPVLA